MWYDMALNPAIIKAIFGNEVPSLNNVELFKISFDRDGPAIELTFKIENFPKSPPIKWITRGYNVAQICIELIDVVNVNLRGWSNNNYLNISFKEIDDNLHYFVARGSTCEIEITFEWLRIVAVSGYTTEKV
jgi:hypothetical protein